MSQSKSVLYSQNFLRSSNLARKLIEMSSLTKDDLVMEIGAGKGIITAVLIQYCKNVVAFEIDDKLFGKLHETFKDTRNIKLVKESFLNYNLPLTGYKIFSNIPFNITSDIIRKLVTTEVPPVDTYLIVQSEAARKFVGNPYGKETLFAILIKPRFTLEIIHKFTPADFNPSPRVDIVLLHIKQLGQPFVEKQAESMYKDFVTFSFSQWKPTLREGLKTIFTNEQFIRLSKDLKFNVSAMPTNLDFNQWLGLFKFFQIGVVGNKKQQVVGSYNKLMSQQANLDKIHRTRVAKDWKIKHI